MGLHMTGSTVTQLNNAFARKDSAPVSLAFFGVLPSASAATNVAGFAAAAASGVRDFWLPDGTYNIQLTEGGTLMSFANAQHIRVRGSGKAILNDTTTYTNSGAFTPMFLFDNCKDVEVDGIEYVGPVLGSPTTLHGYQGAMYLRAINGTKNVRADFRATNIRYGVQTGDYADATKGGCSGFDIKVRGSMIGYALAAYYADHIQHDLDVDGVHRVAYVAGCDDVRGVARWKDQYIADVVYLITDCLTSGTDTAAQADPVGAATTSRGSTNIDVDCIDKGSTVYQLSTALGGIGLSRADSVTFRNIRFHGSTGSATVGVSQRVGLFKVYSGVQSIWNRYTYNWNSGITLSNIKIGGSLDHSAQTGDGNTAGALYVLAYDTLVAQAATVRNLIFEDLVMKPSPGNTRSCYLQAPGLTDTGAMFDRVSAVGFNLELLTNATTPTTLRKSKFNILNLSGITGGSRLQLIKSEVSDITDTVTGDSGSLANTTVDDSVIAGGVLRLYRKSKIINLTGAGTISWANAIPAGAVIQSVTGRLLTSVTGTNVTGFAVGVGTNTTIYYNRNTLTAPTSWTTAVDGTTAGGVPHLYQSTLNLLVTSRSAGGGADGVGVFTGGTLRVNIAYWLATAPTS